MLALVVAAGAFGLFVLSSAVIFSQRGSVAPREEERPLRSVGVAPIDAHGDASLAVAAARMGEELEGELARQMPRARVVAGRAADVRFYLEGELRPSGGGAELVLRVIDARDGREAGRTTLHVASSSLREPDVVARNAADAARRLVTTAMLGAAAE